MLKIIVLSLILVVSIRAAPGYLHGLELSPSLLSAPLLPSPYLKALPAPLLAPAPILAHAPILTHAPLIAHAPVAPIIKTIAPATSYASVTNFHVAHPAPIIKTILAPQPILKSYIPAPIAFGHGYH